MFTELTINGENNTKLTALTVCSDRLVAILALVYDVHYFGTFASSEVEMNPMAMYGEEDREVLILAYEAYAENKFPNTDVTNEQLLEYQIGYLQEIQDGLTR